MRRIWMLSFFALFSSRSRHVPDFRLLWISVALLSRQSQMTRLTQTLANVRFTCSKTVGTYRRNRNHLFSTVSFAGRLHDYCRLCQRGASTLVGEVDVCDLLAAKTELPTWCRPVQHMRVLNRRPHHWAGQSQGKNLWTRRRRVCSPDIADASKGVLKMVHDCHAPQVGRSRSGCPAG